MAANLTRKLSLSEEGGELMSFVEVILLLSFLIEVVDFVYRITTKK